MNLTNNNTDKKGSKNWDNSKSYLSRYIYFPTISIIICIPLFIVVIITSVCYSTYVIKKSLNKMLKSTIDKGDMSVKEKDDTEVDNKLYL